MVPPRLSAYKIERLCNYTKAISCLRFLMQKQNPEEPLREVLPVNNSFALNQVLSSGMVMRKLTVKGLFPFHLICLPWINFVSMR